MYIRVSKGNNTLARKLYEEVIALYQDGLPYKKAVLATAHKLIRVIFAMLRNQTLFDARMN